MKCRSCKMEINDEATKCPYRGDSQYGAGSVLLCVMFLSVLGGVVLYGGLLGIIVIGILLAIMYWWATKD